MLRRKWKSVKRLLAALSVGEALKFIWHGELRFGRGREYQIWPRDSKFPVWLRQGSSDSFVFKQIFVHREYECLRHLADGGLVIDCGANVGYSSVYLLSVFPKCRVVAVEPDEGNFSMLQRNVEAFGERVRCVRAGVWSQCAPLAISQDKYRDGAEWTKQVRVCGPGEVAEFNGVDINALLAESGQDRISLLKMDIEGAEAVVFSENYEGWLTKVDTIAIELHNDSIFGDGEKVFYSAIEGRNVQLAKSGELVICRLSSVDSLVAATDVAKRDRQLN